MATTDKKQLRKALGQAQRGNKFQLRFPAEFQGENEELTYLVTSTSIPSKGIGTIRIPYMGVFINLPGDLEVAGTWTVTFKLDDKSAAFKAIHSWVTGVLDSPTNTRSSIDEIMKDIDINLLNVNLAATSTFRLQDVFPTEMGDIVLSHEDENSIATWTVTFAYQDVLYNFT